MSMKTTARFRRATSMAAAALMVGATLAVSPAANAAPGYDEPMARGNDKRWETYTTQPSANPAMPDSCGLNATIVVDVSESVTASDLTKAKDAAANLLEVLEGTPSTARVVTFATESPGYQNTNSARVSVNSGAAQLRSQVDGIKRVTNNARGWTNYEAAFDAINQDPGNLVMFITDGANSQNNAGRRDSGRSPNFNFDASLDTPYIAAANRVKSKGARIIPIAVGSDFHHYFDGNWSAGLFFSYRSWMPSFWFMVRGSDGLSRSGRDYHSTENMDQLKSTLQAAATASCIGSLNLTSKVIPETGGTPAYMGGFGYSLAPTGGATVGRTSVTTDSEGASTVNIRKGSGSVKVTQAGRKGYRMNSVSCEDNLTNTPISTKITGTSFTVPVSNLDFVSCTVISQADSSYNPDPGNPDPGTPGDGATGSLGSLTGGGDSTGSLGGGAGTLALGALGTAAVAGGLVWAVQNCMIAVPAPVAQSLPPALLDLLGIHANGACRVHDRPA